MKTFLNAAAIALIAAAAPATANHEGGDPGIDQRQRGLEQRIEQGRRAGELTRHEYRWLQHELRDIAREEQYFKSDGYLSPHERNQLHARLDNLSREIHLQKQDEVRRYGFYNGNDLTVRRF